MVVRTHPGRTRLHGTASSTNPPTWKITARRPATVAASPAQRKALEPRCQPIPPTKGEKRTEGQKGCRAKTRFRNSGINRIKKIKKNRRFNTLRACEGPPVGEKKTASLRENRTAGMKKEGERGRHDKSRLSPARGPRSRRAPCTGPFRGPPRWRE